MALNPLTFENDEDRQAFFDTLKEMGRVLGFLSLLACSLYYWVGLDAASLQTIQTNAEQVQHHQGLLTYYSDGHYFSGGEAQNGEFAHSGQYSLKLTSASAFGFEYVHPYARINEEFTVSVWRFGDGKDTAKGILVASSKGFWKAGEEVVEKAENGWEKIAFTFTPPPESHNHPLKIYCWNNGYEPLYFDDMSIEVRQKEEL